MELAGKTILVVGATGVLGATISEQLVLRGARVIGTASCVETLVSLPACVSERFVCDLGSESSIDECLEDVLQVSTELDGVVIASGLVAFGSAREVPARILTRLLSVNFTGPVRLINALSSRLSLATQPFVLTLSGKIAEIPTAGIAAYSASKAALHAYASAASREYRRVGIRWIDARPGHTETGLASRSIWGDPPNLGEGLTPHAVGERLIRAICDGETDLASSAFNEGD